MSRKRVSPRNPFSVRYSTDLVLVHKAALVSKDEKPHKYSYSVFQSAEVQKLWVLGKRQEAKGKREEK